MAELKDKSRAGDIFGEMVKRGRPILTPKERRLVALKQAGEQAKFEVANIEAAIAGLQERLKAANARLESAAEAYSNALTEMEAK